MNTTNLAQRSALKAWTVTQSPLALACTATRRYAMSTPKKPPPKQATPTSKAKAPTTKSKRAAQYEEEDTSSLASRTPFTKPSTGGLGVPGKSPSSNSNLPPSSNGSRTATQTTKNTGDVSALAGDASLTAEQREAKLRTARLRRADQEKERVLKDVSGDDYKRKYDQAVGRWVRGIIAAPILLVTSYYLFDRFALGNKPPPIPKAEDGDTGPLKFFK